MDRKVKCVDITFENIDYIVVPYEYFERLEIRDTKLKESRKDGAWYKAESVDIVLKDQTNQMAKTFNRDLHDLDYGGKTLFEIFEDYPSITHITLICADDFKEQYSVKWHEEDETRNRYQSTQSLVNGNLLITIK